ncbi:uncharacterized protein DNG_04677 [Cephalotrichum gorgonifer]|uniref:Heterokaryon incompatibility domain-containing protein n=1 Tax=Cephalotrichum gorgonifer TaxID=2041049 RepID=A0AAE8MYL1_9PEZI|nr:uncharacterized protein DNG_04677 [Cephalotrichum gorgonifer]
MPSPDKHAPIQCQLFAYALPDSEGTRPYEALSYVWGSEAAPSPICIDGCALSVTVNLHAALSHLRDPYIERILWIDALCINQTDKNEKALQIQLMAKIYATASSVTVWLGEAAPDSGHAIEVIRTAALQKSGTFSKREPKVEPKKDMVVIDPFFPAGSPAHLQAVGVAVNPPAELSTESPLDQRTKDAILALLQRPWFRRIWVLQEVAAARHVLIKCGPASIDGYAFCVGLSGLALSYIPYPGLRELTHSITYLVRGAIFRPRDVIGISGRFSLDIRPMSELVEMYHTREATERHDKIFALLGMSSDDPSTAGLSVDYRIPWGQLFKRLIHFCTSEQVSVSAWDDEELAVIRGKGCMLGRVTSVKKDAEHRQKVAVTWTNSHGYFGNTKHDLRWIAGFFSHGGWATSNWILQPSARSVQEGDAICLLEGASRPTIIRLQSNYWAVVMISVPPTDDPCEIRGPGGDTAWSDLHKYLEVFPHDLLLTWDWNSHQEGSGDDDELCTRHRDPSRQMTELDGYIDQATSLSNTVGPLEAVGNMKLAERNLRRAMERFGEALRVERPDGVTKLIEDHGGWIPLWLAAGMGNEGVVKHQLDHGADPDAKDKYHGNTPLLWAAENGHESTVKLLLDSNADQDIQGKEKQTPLWRTVVKEHGPVVKLLLDARTEPNSTDIDHRSMLLSLAADKGYKEIAKPLIDGGANPNVNSYLERTPLSLAAENGHETLMQLLLDSGAVPDRRDKDGQTALWWATKMQHEAIIKLLIARKADPNATNEDERADEQLISGLSVEEHAARQTALHCAVVNGYEAVAKLLIELGANMNAKNGLDSWTALHSAARFGHASVARMLVDMGAQVDATDDKGYTPLYHACIHSYSTIARLLIGAGAKVDVRTDGGKTLLHHAAKDGSEAIARLLVDSGADIDAKDDKGWRPLHFSCYHRKDAVSRILLDAGADRDASDKFGWPLRHYLPAEEYRDAEGQLLTYNGNEETEAGGSSRSDQEKSSWLWWPFGSRGTETGEKG